MKILIFAGLSDKKLISKIEPITRLNFIQEIIIIRKTELKFKKVNCISPKYKIFKNIYLFELYRIVISVKILFKEKISLIIGIQMTYHGLFSFYLSKIFGVDYIFNLIESFDFTYTSRIYRKVISSSNLIVTRGVKVINEINKYFKKYILCVYVPNNFSFNNIGLNKTKVDSNILIYCGSFSKSKRVDIMIEAVKIIKEKYKFSNYTIRLFGDGELKQGIINKAIKYNLDNIEFNPYLKNIDDEIMKSKIFIMTSEFEGQPMAMVEALACGIPVIMPNISNIPDLAIDGYNALLVEPLDTEGFAEAIYKLMTDDELYKKLKKGAENFREEHEYEFSMENITNIWNDIFIKLGLIEKENTNANK